MSTPHAHTRTRRAQFAVALLGTLALALATSTAASASLSQSAFRAQQLCNLPQPGSAGCLGIRLISTSLTSADLKANAVRQTAEAAHGVTPAVTNKTPIAGGLTPAQLHAAYALATATFPATQQTVAVVDAYNDPTAEADLAVYDKEFGLPACTSSNGCFKKLNQEGKSSPLPATEGGWATEISLDVQMAHAICQSCHVLLVEAANSSFAALGAAVNAAVKAGATEVSNSYGGAEAAGSSADNGPYDHPGIVITASAGDCGYFNEACGGTEAANFPASSPDVVAVGGTSLNKSGENWSSTVWNGSGSGCSIAFTAPLWQSGVANFSATACGSGRSVGDVAAVANPYTGVDVYDSTPSGGDPTGWGVWGGTSAASPVIAAEFGLAGGSQGVQFPAATLYSHIGESDDLYDVVSGSNGSCTGATACEAAVGYDGPTGVGSPVGLGAFALAASPTNSSPPSISGTAEEGQVLTLSHGEWSNKPTAYSDHWLLCNAAGASCAEISGATGTTYTLPAAAVGSSVRVQEIASNASGTGTPAVSSATGAVISNAPVVTNFTPSSAVTGSAVTITGTAFTGASQVRFDGVKATYTVNSSTQIEATVPNGVHAGTVAVTTKVGTGTSKTSFTPSLSVESFSPTKAAPGASVTITGVGFSSSSKVSFGEAAATSVTYVSASKTLKVTVPAGAHTGTITVTNTSAPSGSATSATSFTVS
jgi:subtilase family serine protease